MPLTSQDDFGTSADGSRVRDYCRFCFRDGEFTDPAISQQDMISKCVGLLLEKNVMSEPQARTLMQELIPTLKRWLGAVGASSSMNRQKNTL